MTVLAKPKAETHQQQLARLEGQVEALRQQLRRAQRLASVGTMTAMVGEYLSSPILPICSARMWQS